MAKSALVTGTGVLRLLEAMRSARVSQAATSGLYGRVSTSPQSETTPFYPRSPYGVAKLYAFNIVRHDRESYGMHATGSILFNQESRRRVRAARRDL